MKTINLKSWNETEGRIRYYKESTLKNGKKCRHSIYDGRIKKIMPKRYDTFQKQIFTNGKWENVKEVA